MNYCKSLPMQQSCGGLHWLRYLSLSFCLMLAVTADARARTDADPSKEYKVSPAQGPWMVIVTSYTGPAAAKMAHDLVLELRSRYDLPAYVFNRGAEERKKQQEELARRREQQKQQLEQMGLKPEVEPRLRTFRIEDQYAVLVGGYKDFDAASKALGHIKKLEPPKTVPLDKMGFAPLQPQDQKKTQVEQETINPFRMSFVVHNPTVPVERHQEKPDPFLKELNADEGFSLLKTKKPWTLAVKDYHRATVVQDGTPTNFIEKLFGKNDGSTLDAMGKQAHEIAFALRKMNIDAYVLHTRWSSIVTVGSYDSPNDPQLLQYQRVLANLQLANPQQGIDIRLFAKPMPMEVPRP